MSEGMNFVAAAYGITVLTFVVYGALLYRRTRRAEALLRDLDLSPEGEETGSGREGGMESATLKEVLHG